MNIYHIYYLYQNESTRISTAWKLYFHVPHFSCLCSVFFYVLRGTYAPIGVGQIIVKMNNYDP